jgi:hypothetical protein
LYISPKAGQVAPKAGQVSPKAGEVAPKAGEVAPKAGQVAPKAGQVAPKAGEVAPKAVSTLLANVNREWYNSRSMRANTAVGQSRRQKRGVMDVPYDLRLAPGAEQVIQSVAAGRFTDRTAYLLQLEAWRLALVAGFDELVCLDALNFTPFDYQVKAAQTALRRFRGRGLLCDEVGLGKTIEAGLVLKEYLMRQMLERVLILTPPALVEQWREELASKFGLADFVSSYDHDFRELGSRAWEQFPHVIASLATARRAEHRRAITQVVYDLVVVDEAHHLKNRSSVSWKLVNALQKKYILFLTGPTQNPARVPSPIRRPGRPAPAQEPGAAARVAGRRHGAPRARPGGHPTAAPPRPHHPPQAKR